MVISVASGKGGTGKTFVSTNLAFSVSQERNVQLLDCDVEEPNDHIFLKPHILKEEPVFIKIPEIDDNKCTHCGKCAELCVFNALAVLPSKVLLFDHLCHGCGVCSYFCPEGAIAEKNHKIGSVKIGKAGKMDFIQGELMVGEAITHPVIKQAKEYIDRGKTVIIDSSPGTSCPVVEAVKDSDFCILVTEPTPFGFNDLKLAVEMVNELGVRAGVVINRVISNDHQYAFLVSEEKSIRMSQSEYRSKKSTINKVSPGSENPQKYYDILKNYCTENNLPVLMEVSLDIEVAEFYSKGLLLAEKIPSWRSNFQRLFEEIMSIV